MKKTISARQAGMISLMCIIANKILLLPSLIYQDIKADALFVMIILFALDIVALPIFIKMKKTFPNMKLQDILKSKLCPIFAKFIIIVLLVYFFFKTILTFSIVYLYLKQQVYQDDFIFIAFICILPLTCLAVAKGIRPIARTIELFYGFVVAGFLICVTFSLFTKLSSPIFFDSSAQSFLMSIYKNIFSFGDFIFLFLIIDRIDLKKGQEKKLYFHSLLGMALVVILYYIFYSKYHITAFMHTNALSDVVVFSVQFNALGRLDVIAMVLVMFITAFQFLLFSYACCDCLINLFPLMKLEYAIGFFAIVFTILYNVFLGKYEVVVNWFGGWQAGYGMAVNYFLPVLFLIITLAKNQHKKGKGGAP